MRTLPAALVVGSTTVTRCSFRSGRKEQSFGYNVDPEGKLLALPAPFRVRTGDMKDCAGPGDYNTEEKSWWAGVGAAKFSRGLRKTLFDGECVTKDKRPVGQRNQYCPGAAVRKVQTMLDLAVKNQTEFREPPTDMRVPSTRDSGPR